MIHLYAFVDELDRMPARCGATGEALDRLRFGDVTAVVGEIAAALPVTTEGALAHDAVVESLLEHAASVLPARLRRPFTDLAALAAATECNLPALRRTLACVRGSVELGVRVSRDEAAGRGRPADGAAYMRQLAAAEATRRALAGEVQAVLRPCAVDSRIDNPREPATLFRGAYLVRRVDVSEFGRRATRLSERHPDAAVLCTGPWAPYSFVEEAV